MRRAWLTRLTATAVVLAGLLLGRLITTGLSTESVLEDPIEHRAAIGEPVQLRENTVRVFEAARAPTVVEQGLERGSSGRWVVLTYEVSAPRVTAAVAQVSITDGSGRLWRSGSRLGGSCPAVPPGLLLTCTAAVEVPEDLRADAVARLAPALDERADAVVVVPLARDGALPAVQERIEVAAPRFVSAPVEEAPGG